MITVINQRLHRDRNKILCPERIMFLFTSKAHVLYDVVKKLLMLGNFLFRMVNDAQKFKCTFLRSPEGINNKDL